MKIVKAEKADIEKLTALLYELDKFHFSEEPSKYRSPEEMNEKRIEKDIFSLYEDGKISVFLAIDKGKLIGFVSGTTKKLDSIISKPRVVGFINELVVLPEYRGLKVSELLMKKIEEFLMKNGAQEFGLNVASFNMRAINFYKKLGYTVDSHLLTKKLVQTEACS